MAISLILAGATALFDTLGWFEDFEGFASDQAFPRGEPDDSLAVVAIDDDALAAVPSSWPWERSVHAELVRALDRAGARVIVLDIAFVDPQDGDAELAQAIREAGNVVLSTITATSTGSDNDEGDDEESACEEDSDAPDPNEPDDGRRTSRTNGPTSSLQCFDLREPVEVLATAAAAVGHTNVTPDVNDGIVREVPLVVQDHDGRVVPSLALAALSVAAGEPPQPIMRRPSGVQVAGRAVPTDEQYKMRISYPHVLTDRTVDSDPDDELLSAADVLQGRADGLVADRVVYVGVTDLSLGDRHLTPVAKGLSGQPGVMAQASAYNTIATRNYISLASTLETTLLVFAIALIVTLAVQFLPAWLAGAVGAVLVVSYLWAFYLRIDTGTIMNVSYPTLAVALAVPLSGAVRYLVEVRQRRQVAALFSQYVPADVAAQLIDEGRVGSAAEGARVDATAMFVDLRGFTSLSSTLEPAQVNAMLSDFYEYTSGLVLEHRGTVMTYIGDEVFAIFGAPIPSDDHAARALACARELQEGVAALDAALERHGFPPLRFGIGVNAGEMVVSHAGSTWRRQYTAIGDTVNVASRLCGQAGPGQVVLSEAVRAAVEPPPKVEPLGPVRMKGVREDFQAWRLVLEHPPSGTSDR